MMPRRRVAPRSVVRPTLVGIAVLAAATAATGAPFLSSEQRLPDDDVAGDHYGEAVALDGNTAVVGSRDEGVSLFDAPGAAFVYERDPSGTWVETKELTASDGAHGDAFGSAVAIDGDLLVVTAMGDGPGGSAYVLGRDVGGPDNWGEIAKIGPSDPSATDNYGESVSISGDTVVVGAGRKDDFGFDSGAAYVYQRDEGGPDNWGQVKKLVPGDIALGDLYGESVAVDGDRLVVGARGDDDGVPDSGSAYVHERDAGGIDNWGQVGKLHAAIPGTDDWFGYPVRLVGDRAAVGASNADPGGAAYLFERDAGGPGNWGEVKKLVASDAAFGDAFGVGIGLVDSELAVGARWNEHHGASPGAVYVFERDAGGAGNWGEVTKLTTAAGYGFGTHVAMETGTVFVGTAGISNQGAYLYESPTVRMFVTSAAYAADFGGLAGGDAICQTEADAASVPGLWLALLSVPGTDRFTRLPTGVRIERVDFVPLANDAADLDGPIDAPLEAEPGGGIAPVSTRVWTGDSDGDGSCLGFTATAGDTGSYGLTSETDDDWQAAGEDACSASNRLYCFQSVCPSAPVLGCEEGWGKASLRFSQKKPGKEKLRLSLRAGPALTQPDLGAPLDADGTAYTACVYDDASRLVGQFQVNRAGDDCGGRPCWKAVGGLPPNGKGYVYKDKLLESDGIKQLKLLGGPAGKSKIQWKGDNNAAKGLTALPARLAEDLAGSTSATVQIHGDDPAHCHGATLPDVKRAFVTYFRADD